MKPFKQKSPESLQQDVAKHYADNLAKMSSMIILGLDTEEESKISLPPNLTIIENNEGYLPSFLTGAIPIAVSSVDN
ncbi:hypothetical protein [Candidatus Berkiella aquae]|uniref:Uncharacterized protein n=1 Tax=Candidatus Berkiella aquae TaxID=295108 RepID=A0A0Q9Z1Q1_9GAMM|nr:hypothetical protein [Candidatus Berkiella aquae]MCS5712147.1 hypothetical protein [Candidatus Berkiella aquae]